MGVEEPRGIGFVRRFHGAQCDKSHSGRKRRREMGAALNPKTGRRLANGIYQTAWSYLLAMLLNKISEYVLIGLRINHSATKARITFRLEWGSVVRGEGKKANPLGSEHDVREKFFFRPADFAFSNFCPTTLETLCHILSL
jgi:hypothetical protein